MTIRHVVVWKLAADEVDTRALHAEQVTDRLLALSGVIPEILRIQVGPNVAYPGKNWDVALIADFADVDALERYQIHPDHQKVAAFVQSLVSDRASIDIPVEA